MAHITKEGFELSPSQEAAYIEAEKRNGNVFITGSAGNGKSVLTRELTTENTLVIAPTGIAAVNVGGVTAYSALKMPITIPSLYEFKKYIKDLSFLEQIDRVIISEIGMVRSDVLSLIEARLRVHRKNRDPWGGVQVIGEGDFLQIEPIVTSKEKRQFELAYPDGKYCFKSPVWDFKMCELTHPQRHPNPDQYALLQRLRKGDKTVLNDLVDMCKPYEEDDDDLKLCCFKDDAEKINDYWFNKLKSEVHTFIARVEGKISLKDKQAPEVLRLRVGAEVVVCANKPDRGYVNGDRGIVLKIEKDVIAVKLKDGREVQVERHEWKDEAMSYGVNGLSKERVGSFTQFPLMHGWAVSVHKSQGMTLEGAALHVGNGCFANGQLYVAVTRVKDIRNLSLVKKLARADIRASQDVLDFYGY